MSTKTTLRKAELDYQHALNQARRKCGDTIQWASFVGNGDEVLVTYLRDDSWLDSFYVTSTGTHSRFYKPLLRLAHADNRLFWAHADDQRKQSAAYRTAHAQ